MKDFKALQAKLKKDLITINYGCVKYSSVTLPLLYPSGGWVLINIENRGENFYVSDDSGAFDEAFQIGAVDLFEEHATNAAKEYGVDIYDYGFFCANITMDELIATIVLIANASIIAARNISEAEAKRMSEARTAT